MNTSSNEENISFNVSAIEETIKRGASKLPNTQFTMNNQAKQLVSEYVKIFTVEAVKRSIRDAEIKHDLNKDYRIALNVNESDDYDKMMEGDGQKELKNNRTNEKLEVTYEHLENIAAQLFFDFK
jgi:hypothetical protein